MEKKETATENIKVRPSTKRRLDTFGKNTYDGIIRFLIDFYDEKCVEDIIEKGEDK